MHQGTNQFRHHQLERPSTTKGATTCPRVATSAASSEPMSFDQLAEDCQRKISLLLRSHLNPAPNGRSLGQKRRTVFHFTPKQLKDMARRYKNSANDSQQISDDFGITIDSLRNLMSRRGVGRK